MPSVISNLLEDLEGLLESHSEYADVIDDGNIEARHLHDEVGRELHRIRRSLKALAKQSSPQLEEVEEIEDSLAEVDDALAELAAAM